MGIKLIRIKEFYELGDNNSINSLIPKIRVQTILGVSLRAGLSAHTAQALAMACTEALEVAGIRAIPNANTSIDQMLSFTLFPPQAKRGWRSAAMSGRVNLAQGHAFSW